MRTNLFSGRITFDEACGGDRLVGARRRSRWSRLIGINAAIVISLLLLFDLASFFLLPDGISRLTWPYRCRECAAPLFSNDARGYPRGYFVADARKGSDIAPGFQPEREWVEGTLYDVWSNRLGCFDTSDLPGGDYIYLAGDSFAWGFTPFEAKFGRLLVLGRGSASQYCRQQIRGR